MKWSKFKKKILHLELDEWLTHKEIAEIINNNHHSTYCGLSELEHDGIIEIDKRSKTYKYRIIRELGKL